MFIITEQLVELLGLSDIGPVCREALLELCEGLCVVDFAEVAHEPECSEQPAHGPAHTCHFSM